MKTNYMSLLVAAGVGLAIGLYFTGSVGSVLPLLFILACPLMMIFMMKGMSHGSGPDSTPESSEDLHRHPNLDAPERRRL